MVLEREKCLFGHVHTVTKFVGYVTIVLNALSILGWIGLVVAAFTINWNDYFKRKTIGEQDSDKLTIRVVSTVISVIGVIGAFFGIAMGAILLYALRNRRPVLYWVYIIVTAFETVMNFFNILPLPIFAIVLFVVSGSDSFTEGEKSGFVIAGVVVLLIFLISIFILVAQAYFGIYVVNKSRQLLDEEVCRTRNVQVTPIAPQYQQNYHHIY